MELEKKRHRCIQVESDYTFRQILKEFNLLLLLQPSIKQQKVDTKVMILIEKFNKG